MSSWVRAGLIGAAFSGAPSTALAALRGHDVLASTEAVGAAFLPGPAPRQARLAVGAAAHVLLSLMWARVLAQLLREPLAKLGSTRTDGAVAGAICGLAIGALDLGFVGRRLPTIRSLPIGPQLADHLTYGALVGWALKGD